MVISGKFYILLLATSLFCLSFASGQVKFYTQVNESTIQFPQTFQVQYVIEGARTVDDFRLPEFSEFRVDGTFDYHNTTSIQAQTRQLLESYVKIAILSPRRTGKFTIPGAVAIVDGKRMTSTPVKVVVQRTGLATASAPAEEAEVDMESATELQPGEDVTAEIHRNFFLRTEVNKKDCYVGEPVMAVYKAYSRLSTTAQVTKRPSLNGFSVIEMVDGYDNKQEIEVYKGKAYYVNIIRKVQLIPLQEGSFSLDPAEVEGMVHFRRKDPQSGSWSAADYPVSVKSEPVEMTIRPLPAENQPDHYTGAVGKFDIAVNAPLTPIRQGDLVKIQVVISGTGNLNLITAPVVRWPRGVDTADPAVRENVNKYIYPLTGSKEFEYSFAAPDTGICVIPAVELAYYDPYLKEYKIATSQSASMQVMPGASKSELKERNEALERANQKGIPRHLYFFGAIVLLIAGWIFYQSWQLRRSRRMAKPLVREEKPVVAPPPVVSPEEQLAVAREALQHNNKRLFCQEIQQVLWKAIEEQCAIAPSTMNKQHIAGALTAKGVPPETVQQLLRVLHECEWALYTPGEQVDDMKRIFYESKDLLHQLRQA